MIRVPGVTSNAAETSGVAHERPGPTVCMFVSSSHPKTGGEIYLARVSQYLAELMPVVLADFQDMPAFAKRNLFTTLLFSNFWGLSKILAADHERLVLFEDFHYHPRLFLLNFLIRRLERVKIISLVQLGLHYHHILDYRLSLIHI